MLIRFLDNLPVMNAKLARNQTQSMSVPPWHDGNEQFTLHLIFLQSKSTFECRRKLWWFHCVELYLGAFEIWSCPPCLVAIIKRHHAVSVAVTDRRKTTFLFGFWAKLNTATTFPFLSLPTSKYKSFACLPYLFLVYASIYQDAF